MSVIRTRAGTVPAANTLLPTWDAAFPMLIAPNKLKIGDDLKGANAALHASAPSWNKTGSAKTWSGAAFTRAATGAARTANNGRQVAVIDCGLADVRALVRIGGVFETTDNPVLVFRYQDDNNYWYFGTDIQNNICRLNKRIGGVATTAAAGYANGGGVFASGSIFEVRAVGNTITVLLNGVVLGTATDSDLNTATKVGFSQLKTGGLSVFSNFMAGVPS